jgi:hypothetical protein
MGIYVYRITAKRVLCSDGEPANVAVFAYKPYWDIDRHTANAKMHFKSGATSSDTQARKGKLSARIVLGDSKGVVYRDAIIYARHLIQGSFYDNHLGDKFFPAIEGLTLANPDQYPICEWSV